MYSGFDILLNRKLKIIVKKGNEENKSKSAPYVVAMMKNIEALGFTMSENLVETLLTNEKNYIVGLYSDLIPRLKALVGADKVYKPMYPNFPHQVLEASEAELFINAILHYFSFGKIIPEYEKEERFPLIKSPELKVISIGTEKELMEIFTNILGSKTSISEQDKKDIKFFIENTDYKKYLPKEIPMKETKAVFGKILIESAPALNAKDVKSLYGTATDVLRLLVAISDGDVSLSDKKTRIRKLKRRERRFIMDLLMQCDNILEDLFRYRALWIVAAEIIHPREFSDEYKKVKDAFKVLRDNEKPLFFAGTLEDCIRKNDIDGAVCLLEKRPGEFARRLDELYRMDSNKAVYVADHFAAVAEKVSTPVLWQVMYHFKHRNDALDARVFFPKGSTAKVYATTAEALKPIPEQVSEKTVKACYAALVKQYKGKENLGKVYVDKEFTNYIVPFSQRSASTAFKIITRGSRVPIDKDADVLRSYIWWTNMEEGYRVDIDLSATIYNEDWKYMEHISYTNLRSEGFQCAHSGDITDGGHFGGDGAAEFIDISLDNVLENNGRYVLMQVYAYTEQPFSSLPCSFGWMSRSDMNSGEVFEPKTVDQNMALSSNSTAAIPIIIDCKERVVIWADMSLSSRNDFYGNNLESNFRGVTASAYAIANMHRPSLYDLVLANIKARGVLVLEKKDADIIFSNDTSKPMIDVIEFDEDGNEVIKQVEKDVKIITAYDLDYYMGQML